MRKNIATAFATAVKADDKSDPWETMFAQALADGSETHQNELYPYWISPDVTTDADGRRPAAKIERHVPLFPHSREVKQQADLQRTLVLYRMV